MKPQDNATIATLLAFWRDAGPKRWFARNDDFDADFRERYTALHMAAARREIDHWADSADGTLALLLLLDQFPRNAYRGTAHMFATDALARHFARAALAAGHDQAGNADLVSFFYMPFEHSEDPVDQAIALEHLTPLGGETARYARIHQDIIERFGRFPHRNPMFGRTTTAAESDFLREGGFSG